jgi:hypothetical protein
MGDLSLAQGARCAEAAMTAARKAKLTLVAIKPPFATANVRAKFNSYPGNVRASLIVLRGLIFETAKSLDGVGEIEETLKWGQPSYLTSSSKSGSTIRIDALKDNDGYAVYFHCQTNLVETFRELYPAQMTYGGNRSILFRSGDKIPEKALRHCIGLALTYHARQKPIAPKKAPAKKAISKKQTAKKR